MWFTFFKVPFHVKVDHNLYSTETERCVFSVNLTRFDRNQSIFFINVCRCAGSLGKWSAKFQHWLFYFPVEFFHLNLSGHCGLQCWLLRSIQRWCFSPWIEWFVCVKFHMMLISKENGSLLISVSRTSTVILATLCHLWEQCCKKKCQEKNWHATGYEVALCCH